MIQFKHKVRKETVANIFLLVWVATLLAGCIEGGGGGGDENGPAIQARPQTITFSAAPTLSLGSTATVSATASSGLPVTYQSDTPFICTIVASTGLVTALTPGNCIIAADQYGDSTYAPVRQTQSITVYVDPHQTISFAPPPALSLYGSSSVSASASSGLPVSYSSATPAVCTVNPSTGLVTDLTLGDCIITANQAGNATYNAAPQAIQTLSVSAPLVITAPEAPTGVTATMGSVANTVMVSIGGVNAGGSPITGFTVTSSPAGLTGTGTSFPVTVTCPGTCNGYAFSVTATNAVGAGAPSAPADVITTYNVVETFYEPATQPNDSIFTGTFTFNSTAGTVSNLAGNLTESMSGGCATLIGCPGSYGSVPMTLVPLSHQLKVQSVTLGGVQGLLVTTFALPTTNTFLTFFGGDGWSPSAGVDVGGIYFGFPTAPNPAAIGGVGNAYAMIFVNTSDPTTPLAQAQIDMLAYADCAPGGMMGAVCMTGTSIAGYGIVGTMGGYPVSQVITKQ